MRRKIFNVRVIDVVNRQAIENGTVVFDESGIIEISQGTSGTETADWEFDGTGMTLLPGLIDSHVHLGMNASPDPFQQIKADSEADTAFLACSQGRQFLSAGITTVRNVGTRYNVDIVYRQAVERGLIEGPRVYASGQPIVMTGGHCHPMAIEADGADEVRKAARRQLKAGADLLKLMATGGVLTTGTDPGSAQLSEWEMKCACEEADHAGKTTAAHAIGLDGIKNAIRAGVTTIEHGSVLDEEAIQMMLERGTYLVPTLIAATLILRQPPDSGIPEDFIRKAEPFVQRHRESFRDALRSGVKMAAGTDAGTPFNTPGLLADELQLMHEEGMAAIDAIHAATLSAATFMKLDDRIGSIEVGKWADLLLVEGNPLSDLLHLKQVRQVYKGGLLCAHHP
ncbi:amidohydrolase family protein [Brevibacillus ruminantium]|uniref:Amidohydrolase family protein n=1 Tax=Brevibacillus ruminantium TaxID=2950604 RepID=A0ABY4WQ05_9BACL|nr:amidohydrolase family protein [Brevibacillus ruminantium]USG68228.1 amidohydrolase family protein [Brevibacillus ruminantium]